jgi:putative MATE family efflux protein
MNRQQQLTTQPIPKLIQKITIPASIGFFFNTMYNVVDTYYGGLLSTQALAALSLSFPIFFIILAMGSGIANGATSLIANSLGAGNKERAEKYGCQAISFSIIFSIFLTTAGLLISPTLFKILGAQGEYLRIALSYANVIFYGAVFFLLTHSLNGILIAEGDTKTFRNLLILGFFLNLVLDPWFMFGGLGLPALGLAGVAWATITIQLILSSILFVKIRSREPFKHFHIKHLIPNKEYYLDIIKQGFPASLNMMSMAIGIFVTTYFISSFGKSAIAAYGIATRIEQIAVLPAIGLNIAMMTLIGNNNGAQKFDRVRETFSKGLKYGIFLVLISISLVLLFSKTLMEFFSNDLEVIKIGYSYLKIAILMYLTYIIINICVATLQGLKKPIFALWLGLYRFLIMPGIIIFTLIKIMHSPITSIWWALVFINWSAAIFTLLYTKKKLKELV